MAAPNQPERPETCEECGSEMERVTTNPPSHGTEGGVRLICPRCGHEA